jgi:hypothetical protein
LGLSRPRTRESQRMERLYSRIRPSIRAPHWSARALSQAHLTPGAADTVDLESTASPSCRAPRIHACGSNCAGTGRGECSHTILRRGDLVQESDGRFPRPAPGGGLPRRRSLGSKWSPPGGQFPIWNQRPDA